MGHPVYIYIYTYAFVGAIIHINIYYIQQAFGMWSPRLYPPDSGATYDVVEIRVGRDKMAKNGIVSGCKTSLERDNRSILTGPTGCTRMFFTSIS